MMDWMWLLTNAASMDLMWDLTKAASMDLMWDLTKSASMDLRWIVMQLALIECCLVVSYSHPILPATSCGATTVVGGRVETIYNRHST